MRSPGMMARMLIFLWIILVISIFVVVTVPAEGRLLTVLPKWFWQVRDLVFPLFHSPAAI